MRSLNKYNDFINESQIQLLLEANIVFDKKFVDLLNLIQGNELKDKLLSLQGKEIDVNTNHITFNLDKEDKVFFIPEDRVKRAPAKVKNPFQPNAPTCTCAIVQSVKCDIAFTFLRLNKGPSNVAIP